MRDLDTALCKRSRKLEKQVVKLRNRWRDTHRDAKGSAPQRRVGKRGTRPPVAEPKPKAANKLHGKNGQGQPVRRSSV